MFFFEEIVMPPVMTVVDVGAVLVKLAALLHEIYGSFDLCHLVLAAHDRRFGTSFAQRYGAALRNPQQKPG